MLGAANPGAATVAISGRGIAANCCAHLLDRAGISTSRRLTQRSPVPAIMLSEAALALLRDIFEKPGLFADRPRLTRRVVAWGAAEPISLPHDAIVLSEQDLDAALGVPPSLLPSPDGPTDFAIHTALPFPEGCLHPFGSRRASAAKATLAPKTDRSTCWIESTARGWLFLIPTGGGEAWLLAVGDAPERLLAQSHHIAGHIASLGDASAVFETSPRMLTAMQGPGWLACGTAAIGFDPICGDGTAQSVREAIMASAVIGAMRAGEDAEALHSHYDSMMIAAMRRHLRLCAQFYASGGQGEWWRAQLADLVTGFDWCTARLASRPEPRFELRDFRLVARAVVA